MLAWQYRLAQTSQAKAHARRLVAATPIGDKGTDVDAPPTKATSHMMTELFVVRGPHAGWCKTFLLCLRAYTHSAAN